MCKHRNFHEISTECFMNSLYYFLVCVCMPMKRIYAHSHATQEAHTHNSAHTSSGKIVFVTSKARARACMCAMREFVDAV